MTKQVNGHWTVVARHDYMPFGEEVAPPSPPQDKRLFTGKERDNETGQDYFGARYYRADIGRFTTVDPLTASARTPAPQTFNRYAYALNNPLRFVDPDGLQASKACAENPNCTIEVRVRVLWDSGAGHETGVSKEQKRAFEQYLLSKARKDFGTANVALSVTYDIGVLHRGTATPGLDHNFPLVENTKGDSLNVLVSQVGVRKGIAGLDYKATGTIVIGLVDAIPTLDGWTDRIPFYSTPTLTHEMIHDITGTHWAIPALYRFGRRARDIAGVGDRRRRGGQVGPDEQTVRCRRESEGEEATEEVDVERPRVAQPSDQRNEEIPIERTLQWLCVGVDGSSEFSYSVS